MIVTIPSCQKCKTAKMMLDKHGIKYNEVLHDTPYHDDYPIVYMNDKRLCYRDFLIEMKQ